MKRLKSLHRIKVLTPRGIWHLINGVIHEGKTMNLLLYFGAKMYPNSVALKYGETQLSYQELYQITLNLASNLASVNSINSGDRVALLVRNSIESTSTLFAVARTGAHIYLFNPEMSESQFVKLCAQKKIDCVIYEKDQSEMILKTFSPKQSLVLNSEESLCIKTLMLQPAKTKIGKRKAGSIVVLTGGTTGDFKAASRKQTIMDFINPLVALIDQMQLHQFKKVYIPTPIYHGYGLASLTVSILLGSEIYLTNGFKAAEACRIVKNNDVEVVTLVPIMLSRMLKEDPQSLVSLKRILSGGAALSPELIANTTKQLGKKLYNLYGTSEAGFCVLGTPDDLISSSGATGRAILGVKIRINSDEEIGMLEVKSKWVMKAKKNKWVETGDLAFIDKTKLISLKGRSDSMIISGGENVYPQELEDVLFTHPNIDSAAVIGIPDAEFGARLQAFVCWKPNGKISEIELKEWLKTKIARYQMPASITFLEELPFTSIGKVDKRSLRTK